MASYIDPRKPSEPDRSSSDPSAEGFRTSETMSCPLQRLVAMEHARKQAERDAELMTPPDMFLMIQARYG
ncbi:MAG: hypothetical protein GY952_14540 [Rhodobacteraceae bacterium]|nr:hypothetical protein [Paracoccaceae bacterium]